MPIQCQSDPCSHDSMSALKVFKCAIIGVPLWSCWFSLDCLLLLWLMYPPIYISWRLCDFGWCWTCLCTCLAGLMDLCMQHSLVSRDTLLIGVRMVLKLLVAAGWMVIFTVFYRWGADELLKDFNQFFRDEVVQCSNWCTFMYCFFFFTSFWGSWNKELNTQRRVVDLCQVCQFMLGDYATFCPYGDLQIHVEPATSWPCLDKGCQ